MLDFHSVIQVGLRHVTSSLRVEPSPDSVENVNSKSILNNYAITYYLVWRTFLLKKMFLLVSFRPVTIIRQKKISCFIFLVNNHGTVLWDPQFEVLLSGCLWFRASTTLAQYIQRTKALLPWPDSLWRNSSLQSSFFKLLLDTILLYKDKFQTLL